MAKNPIQQGDQVRHASGPTGGAGQKAHGDRRTIRITPGDENIRARYPEAVDVTHEYEHLIPTVEEHVGTLSGRELSDIMEENELSRNAEGRIVTRGEVSEWMPTAEDAHGYVEQVATPRSSRAKEDLTVHDYVTGTSHRYSPKKNIKAIRLKYRKSLELRRQKSLQVARKALEHIQTKAIRRGTRVEIGPGVLAGSEGRATGRTQWQSWHENADGTWGRAADEIDVSTGPETTWQDGFLPEEYTVVEQSKDEKVMRRGQRIRMTTPGLEGEEGTATGRTGWADEVGNPDGTRGRSADIANLGPGMEDQLVHPHEYELLEEQKAFNVGDRVRTVAGSLPGTVQSVQHNHPNFTNPDGTHQSVAEVTWDDLPNMPTYHPIHFLESDK